MTGRPAPRWGEIYWVDFNPSRGSEQAGIRPAVVISLESFNSRWPVVTVAAITTKFKTGLDAMTVILPAGRPCPQKCQILAFQLLTIDKSRLSGLIGRLDPNQITELKNAVRQALDLF